MTECYLVKYGFRSMGLGREYLVEQSQRWGSKMGHQQDGVCLQAVLWTQTQLVLLLVLGR
jgi:hypothetical protein